MNAAKSTHWVILIDFRFSKAKMLWLMSTPPNVDILDIFTSKYTHAIMVILPVTKYRHRKKKIIFLKTLKQHLQSSFSLSKNIWHT